MYETLQVCKTADFLAGTSNNATPEHKVGNTLGEKHENQAEPGQHSVVKNHHYKNYSSYGGQLNKSKDECVICINQFAPLTIKSMSSLLILTRDSSVSFNCFSVASSFWRSLTTFIACTTDIAHTDCHYRNYTLCANHAWHTANTSIHGLI